MKQHININVIPLLAAVTLLGSGCTTPPPMRTQTFSERQTMFQKMNGSYKVEDERQNHLKTVQFHVQLADKRGQIIAISESGHHTTYPLLNCDIANQAQAANIGDPVESIEELVRCDIPSDYRYSHLYLGKVKKDYVIKNGALLKLWSPINIKSGYLIEFAPAAASAIFDASKIKD